jgi:ribosomal protein L22
MELNSNVQERERAFMLKRAEYIKNHGETSIAEQEMTQELAFRSGHALMNNSSKEFHKRIKNGADDAKKNIDNYGIQKWVIRHFMN